MKFKIFKKFLIITASLVVLSCIFVLSACGIIDFSCKHKWGQWIVSTPATCTVDGEEYRICTICNEREYYTLSAAHTWGQWTVVTTATCLQDGEDYRVCSKCDERESRTTTGTHDYEEGTIKKEATCTTPGEREYTCKVCKTKITKSYILNHTYEETWSYDSDYHWHAATCGCDLKSEKSKHVYKSSACETCGAYEKASMVNSENLANISLDPAGTYYMHEDIDMSGVQWKPFEFTGTLDGNGYTIKNLTISASLGDLGMFTTLKGSVKNIKFENLTVQSTSYNDVYVGGICAVLTGNIENVSVKGSVIGDAGWIGGLAGHMTDKSVISNCVNYATVEGQASSDSGGSGGIIGKCNGGSISESKNYGRVNNKYYAGGIVGTLSPEKNIDLSNLANYGEVSGQSDTGGIIGFIELVKGYEYNGKLENFGNVTGKENVGGIVGRIYQNAVYSHYGTSFKNCANKGNISGISNVGGLFGRINVYGETFGLSGDVFIILDESYNEGNITGETYVGGIMGNANADNPASVIKNSYSSGKISAECYAGAIAGKLKGISVEECKNTRTTFANLHYTVEQAIKYVYVGGFVGYGDNISLKGCSNDATINYSEAGTCIGGLVGYLNSYNTSIEISGCSNEEKISAPFANNVGGLVGYLHCSSSLASKNTIKLNRLTNMSDISGYDNVGGLFGKVYSEITTAIKFVNHGNITGHSAVGEFGGEFTCTSASTLTEYTNIGSVVENGKTKNQCLFGKVSSSLTIKE